MGLVRLIRVELNQKCVELSQNELSK
jgi:hypothetical protein